MNTYARFDAVSVSAGQRGDIRDNFYILLVTQAALFVQFKITDQDETSVLISWIGRGDRSYCDNSEEIMAGKFSELRDKMTPEERRVSVEIAVALRAELPLHQRQQALSQQVSRDSELSERLDEYAALAGSRHETCPAAINVATYLQLDMDASMTVTTLSSREFNQDTSRAKKAAQDGPVFITDRGRPAHVLLTIEAYQKLTGGQESIVDLLAMPGVEDIEFDPPRLSGPQAQPVDLT